MNFNRLALFIVLLVSVLYADAARFSFLPHTVKQPDGAVINCFVSGDEFFNWLHDSRGYTIIQGEDGYFYWGVTLGDDVVPTTFPADKTDPETAGLNKWAKISLARYKERKAFYTENTDQSVMAPHTGTLNNLAVYIRFSDDTEFTTTRQAYDNKFNLPTGVSLKSYYEEVSYSALTISSTHYPECAMTTNFSYQDYHPRSYFEPYNAVTNPGGYNGSTQRTQREHTLLKDAINWVNANSPVPPGLDIDGDFDGNVDNVCFIIRGGNGAWAELLWAHRWVLYTEIVMINGKRVYDYTFQPETQVDVTTLCHEMFHALGAPDLYHYSSDGLAPVGEWDLMEGGSGHMGAYMKWKYTNNSWVSSLPVITVSGTYTLRPLSSVTNNCYKIASPNSPDQFFMVEYRKREGTFEGTLPGSGLLVYRIDPGYDGNASGPPDEVYLYRPGGTPTVNGTPNNAYFSANVHRTKINDNTNPKSFLQNGEPGGLDISGITEADSTISFDVNVINLNDPDYFMAISTTSTTMMLNWLKNYSGSNVVVAYNTVNQFGIPDDGTTYSPGSTIAGGGQVIYSGSDTVFEHGGLQSNTLYFYKAWSLLAGNTYSPGLLRNATTLCEPVTVLPFSEGFEGGSDRPGCWFENSEDPSWQFIAGNGLGSLYVYPGTAHSGLRNACLVDATAAPDYNTLITPVINLSGYKDVKLTFWMFMQNWGSRQDELTVYYRTSPENPWVLLQNYNQSIKVWTEQTIDLPAGLQEVQVGFRGNARWALGICIDDIMINGTSAPTLTVLPANLNVAMEAGSVTFDIACPDGWTALSDAPGWCSVTPSGTGNGLLTATYTTNELYTKRTANITVSAVGMQDQTVSVTQDASNLSVGEPGVADIRLFPNPANGFCSVTDETGRHRFSGISVADLTGREIMQKLCSGKSTCLLDISGLPLGTYLVNLNGSFGSLTRKLIIVR